MLMGMLSFSAQPLDMDESTVGQIETMIPRETP